jgi:hypothetical protein
MEGKKKTIDSIQYASVTWEKTGCILDACASLEH